MSYQVADNAEALNRASRYGRDDFMELEYLCMQAND